MRIEHVIQGGKSFKVFDCAACSYQWTIAETNEQVPDRRDGA